MKRPAFIMVMLLVAGVLLLFIGCGKTQEEIDTDQPEEAVTPVEEITEDVYIEYMAHQMYIIEKYNQLMETDHDKYFQEYVDAMAELPEKMGVTEAAITAYTNKATEDAEAYMEIIDRIGKRAEELLDKDK